MQIEGGQREPPNKVDFSEEQSGSRTTDPRQSSSTEFARTTATVALALVEANKSSVEDLLLEVLLIENVQSQNVQMCKKTKMNVNLNGCAHVRVKKAIKGGRRTEAARERRGGRGLGLQCGAARRGPLKSAGGETCPRDE